MRSVTVMEVPVAAQFFANARDAKFKFLGAGGAVALNEQKKNDSLLSREIIKG